ncbi:lipopolysaccharide transport periplasmic protein LptA [Spongiibacter sp. KMU-166]|uniref:Lipopolysaccharide export system protein LptA n=1 Tax=Spongiibacter thalassae TaxID=2721624 RepID=A0ABX1GIY7_9GAMM|nr:lipopolysaccharide transport periplasmic protein LptA [Spongiibacter thalassae]NKI18915.1 lipopolysaccharide transport periplasmic protein LptA [Spongiibacter thalassae]
MSHYKYASGLLLGLLLSANSLGLPEDRRQAINLSSDKATYENNRGIYTGNVNMSQGSLKIKADKLIIVESDRRVEKVIAEGSPAHFEQQPRSDEGVVVASAQLIEYSLGDEEILLQRDATIRHQGSKISGDRIVYSGRKQMVIADGGSRALNGRVQMTLQPQSNPEDTQQPEAPSDQASEAPASKAETTEPTP